MVSLFRKWIRKFKGKERIVFPIDSELIKRDKIVKEMSKKMQSQSAQLSNVSAEKKEKKDSEDNKKLEQEFIKKIYEEKEKIDKEKFEGTFSFKTFFKKAETKKYKDKIEIVDKDDTTIFGIFGDFVVFPDNDFGILDKDGILMVKGKSMNRVIYKPSSLTNQARRKRLLLPCDKNFNAYPDIEEIKIPESIYDEKTGKIKWAVVKEEPLKKLIIDREKALAEKNYYIERLETTKSDMARNLTETKREIAILKSNKETTKVEVSRNLKLQENFNMKIGELQNKIAVLTKSKEVMQNITTRISNVNDKLIDMLEESKTKTDFNKVLSMLQQTSEWLNTLKGADIQEVVKEEKKEVTPVGAILEK